ncbi:heme NO-binding domain-containing protein [Tropicimonas sediminicola]|uniref:Haem-NO-binding n=1 Tax=Tropicimonas sediminicola TaxID=1031541 RepID=A0A239EV56_9RHOB|nr:heme NO-binding domain-containing protein [Tropicimonas sediminicola]SNS48515.1 Haem-NO-binding [Tropicimonas sediminicola]
MHGLINRSIQCFVRDTYGVERWLSIAKAVGIGPEGFEAMLVYEDALGNALLREVVLQLDKPEEMVLEDVGTYLVSHQNTEAIRRLLRFGGETFADFLHSLDDLPDRAKLAVADLELPELELTDEDETNFTLHVRGVHPGFAFVLVGVLRTMADDYGALVLLDQKCLGDGNMAITIGVLDSSFAEGRCFSLARRPQQEVT